jgi:putative SOS response-associated peptidase YedK
LNSVPDHEASRLAAVEYLFYTFQSAAGEAVAKEDAVCGRYTLEHVEELSERFHARRIHLELPAIYNIAPSLELPVVVEEDDGERVIRLMEWGLLPRWQPKGHLRPVAPINARSETAADKPMFRDLIRWRRCLIPASGFYEWQQVGRRKQPYLVRVRDQPLFAFAGLYDEIDQGGCPPIASYAVLTCRANARLAEIHGRMPVIVRPEHEGRWLSRQITDVDDLEPVMQPLRSEEVIVHPVTTAVNNAHHDTPELIRPRQVAQLPLVRRAS